jgi:hypothetical protein
VGEKEEFSDFLFYSRILKPVAGPKRKLTTSLTE